MDELRGRWICLHSGAIIFGSLGWKLGETLNPPSFIFTLIYFNYIINIIKCQGHILLYLLIMTSWSELATAIKLIVFQIQNLF